MQVLATFFNLFEDVVFQYYNNKMKDYPHINHWIKQYFYFQYIKENYCSLYFFVTKNEGCLLDHAFTQEEWFLTHASHHTFMTQSQWSPLW
jgi:hypothetical protein